MSFEPADAESALALFQKLTASSVRCPRARGDIVRDFLRERAIAVTSLDDESGGPGGASVLALCGQGTGEGPALLLTAALPEQGEIGSANLAAMAALFAALARSTGHGLGFVAIEEDADGGQRSARSLATAHPALLEARAILTPAPERPLAWRGARIAPIVTAFKGRAIVELSATGAPVSAGLPSNESAAYHLTRGLLRLANQGLPLHATPQGRQMFQGLRRRGPGALPLRLLAGGPVIAGIALENLDGGDPLASHFAAALRNTAEPVRLELGHAPAPGEIPGEGLARLDCRLLPGQSASALLFELRACLDDERLALTVRAECPAACAPSSWPFIGAIERAIESLSPDLHPVPWLSAQTPDAAFLASGGAPILGLPLLVGHPAGPADERELFGRGLGALAGALSQALDASRP